MDQEVRRKKLPKDYNKDVNELRLIYTNTDQLMSKGLEYGDYLNKGSPDTLCIKEIKL